MLARLPFRGLVCAGLLFAGSAVCAQQQFPAVEGEAATGGKVVLPRVDGQAWSVVAVICDKRAQAELEKWFAPAYNRFVMKSGLFAASYRADLFLLPIYTGLDKAAYGPSMKALRKNVDADIAGHVVFFKDDAGPVLKALGIEDRRRPYFFTVDPAGRIVHRESGPFTVEKLDALEAPML